MRKVLCHVPEVCLQDQGSAADQIRLHLESALASGVLPTSLPASGVRRLSVDLSEDVCEKIEALGASLGIAPGRVVGGLMFASRTRTTAPMSAEVKEEDASAPTELAPNIEGLRTGQARVLIEAAPHLMGGKLVFAELGTGSGKARLIAHAAAFVLDARDAGIAPSFNCVPVPSSTSNTPLPEGIVAHIARVREAHKARLAGSPSRAGCVLAVAPSIENVSHLVREWVAVRDTLDPKGLRRVGVRLGRGQFVSAQAVENILEDIDPQGEGFSATRAWLSNGMPAGQTDASAAFLSIEPGLRGLMVDLVELAMVDSQVTGTRLDVRACSLRDGQDASLEDEVHYQAHLAAHREGHDLLFTTTALLALDNILLGQGDRAGLLPCDVLALFVDEAHELEPTQADLAAHSLSLSAMIADVNQLAKVSVSPSLKDLKQQIRQLREVLSPFADQDRLPPSPADPQKHQGWMAALGVMKQIVHSIELIGRSVKRLKVNDRQQHTMQSLRGNQGVMKRVLAGNEFSLRGVVLHSPVKGYISLTFGPASVNRHLIARWAVTPAAMFLSGSLFHMTSTGVSARFVAASLGALDRMSQTRPLHPQWLTASPVLFQPAASTMHRFMPPSGDVTPTALEFWLENVATVIRHAAKDAAGGMLVLLTGYERLAILERKLLEGSGSNLLSRVIDQSPFTGVGYCANEFRRLAKAGERPIWLATGPAWVGVDLSDRSVESPEEDHLLTDLVIPAVPFGLNRSTTHSDRLRRMGFVAEIMSTQQRLRQGLGRLVRREGLQGRRIWLLDGRLVNPATVHRFADLRVVPQQYLNQKRIDEATFTKWARGD